jgi:hypothetical protein
MGSGLSLNMAGARLRFRSTGTFTRVSRERGQAHIDR